jgi:hypothetical protein
MAFSDEIEILSEYTLKDTVKPYFRPTRWYLNTNFKQGRINRIFEKQLHRKHAFPLKVGRGLGAITTPCIIMEDFGNVYALIVPHQFHHTVELFRFRDAPKKSALTSIPSEQIKLILPTVTSLENFIYTIDLITL